MPANHTKFIATPEQIEQIEDMARIRLPQWQMATLLGISLPCFADVVKRDKAVQYALLKGRAAASQTIRSSLFAQALGERDPEDPRKWLYQPNFAAAKFWALTQENFKLDNSIELSITQPETLTQADKALEIKRLLTLRALEAPSNPAASNKDEPGAARGELHGDEPGDAGNEPIEALNKDDEPNDGQVPDNIDDLI